VSAKAAYLKSKIANAPKKIVNTAAIIGDI
jgi:hypothetical protein